MRGGSAPGGYHFNHRLRNGYLLLSAGGLAAISLERAMGFEPTTSSLGSGEHPDVTLENKGLTTPPPPACTTACTSKPENTHESRPEGTPAALTADALAALVRQLSPEERARLTEMLSGKGDTGTVDAR
jgi:hypothetical protein